MGTLPYSSTHAGDRTLRRMAALCLLLLTISGSFAQCCYTSPNLVRNPDFSSAYIGGKPPYFTSDATYSTSHGPGKYDVVASRSYGACSGSKTQYDHTSGNSSGRFLWYDTPYSASLANPGKAWMPFDDTRSDAFPFPSDNKMRIDVQKDTWYSFSCWIRDIAREPDCVSGGAPLMGLRINGTDMAQIDLANYTTPCCPPWVYLCTDWFSGSDTTALLVIESRRADGFTDLAIDDVHFGLKSDPMLPPLVSDADVCSGGDITLTASLQSTCPACIIQWVKDTSLSTIRGTGPSLLVKNVQADSVFFVRVLNPGKCASAWAKATVYKKDCAVPLKLLRFNLSGSLSGIVLRWELLQAGNIRGFRIERTGDLSSVPVILSEVPYVAGNAVYTYTDTRPPQGKSYYRIRVIYADGSTEHSVFRSVRDITEDGIFSIGVFPNPVKEGNRLTLEIGGAGEVQIAIRDLFGRKVYEAADVPGKISIPVTFRPGIYIVEITGEEGALSRRLVVN
jgi:hypothetical protein